MASRLESRSTGEHSPIVERPELYDLLEAGASKRVTVVTAQAGSGKTMLIRSWLDNRSPSDHVAWVSVERGESDPQRFWGAMITALGRAAPLGLAIEEMTPAPIFNAPAVTERLVAELVALDQNLLMVVDDVHEIKSADLLSQIELFLGQLPTSVHMVLISRHDPQLGLHRFRLQGELTEIRNQHLRFTRKESQAMLAALGISLSDESLKLLQDRTEGWVAGLRLAAVSMAGHPDPDQFVREFSGSERTVAEYLIAEVLDRQSPEVRQLLVRSSILDRVNGALGDLLTGNSSTERHLSALARSGAFVVALDAKEEWFRFHHLFADLLAVELRHSQPEDIPSLHLAAAKWLAQHEEVLEAIGHALAADDRDLVAHLLIEHYFSLMLDGRRATAHSLLQTAIGNSARPELAVVMAADQLIEGSLDQAAAYLALAERHAGEVAKDRRQRFDSVLFVTRLSLARRIGDLQTVLEVAQPSALGVEPQNSEELAMQNDVRALMLMNLGIVEVWSGQREEGEQHLLAAEELARQIGRPYLEVSCQAHSSQSISWRSFTIARQRAEEVLATAERHGWDTDPVAGVALAMQGTTLAMAGRLSSAERVLQQADDTLRSELEPAVGFFLQMGHGLVSVSRADYPQAIRHYIEAERLGKGLITRSPLALQARCARLFAQVAEGNIEPVQAVLDEMSEAERNTGEVREVTAALALAKEDASSALAALEPTLGGGGEFHHELVLIRSLLLEARARYMLDDTLGSETAIERALDLTEADDLIAPFMYVDSEDLLRRHPRHSTSHGAFVDEILDSFSGRIEDNDRRRPNLSPRVELSETELRVLRYLPSNLSAPEISSELYISVNTVKTHMRNIYTKLDAHSRSEAVERARDLGLLGQSARLR